MEKFILYVCNEDGSTSPIGEFSTESEAMEACIDENVTLKFLAKTYRVQVRT